MVFEMEVDDFSSHSQPRGRGHGVGRARAVKVKSLLMHRERFNGERGRPGFESCSPGSGRGIWQQLG